VRTKTDKVGPFRLVPPGLVCPPGLQIRQLAKRKQQSSVFRVDDIQCEKMLLDKSLKSCEEKLEEDVRDSLRTLKKKFQPAVGKMNHLTDEIKADLRNDVTAITKFSKKMAKRLKISHQKEQHPAPSIEDSAQPPVVIISDCKSDPLPSVDDSVQLQEVVFSVCKSIPVPSVDDSLQLQEVVISDVKSNSVPSGGNSSMTCAIPVLNQVVLTPVVDLEEWEEYWSSSIIRPRKKKTTCTTCIRKETKFILLIMAIFLFALLVILLIVFFLF
jgi:hypothetical protein